jgi:hypothetical protein
MACPGQPPPAEVQQLGVPQLGLAAAGGQQAIGAPLRYRSHARTNVFQQPLALPTAGARWSTCRYTPHQGCFGPRLLKSVHPKLSSTTSICIV